MCDYCGCRSRRVIARLAAEHDELLATAGAVRRALPRGVEAVRPLLVDLLDRLAPHLEVEEAGLFLQLAGLAEAAGPVERLRADHGDMRTARADPDAVLAEGPPAVLRLLDALDSHIQAEEYDLFPAATQLLSDHAWDEIERAATGAPAAGWTEAP